MSSVDNRVVNMQFNNRQFEEGVQTSLKSLGLLKKALHLEDSAKNLSNLEKTANKFSMGGMANSIEQIASKFSNLGIVGITTLQRITNAAITAGTKMAKALTIEPITTGFQEYETKMNAITTILTNTKSKGTTLDDVNKALAELNEYADLTIYNFAEMTRNIGTFTAAGVDLDTSVKAIKGIANLAAGSGSTSQQASTAMYQLSQALAAGSVKLQDWNSVVNAGMGGELFQNALRETAKEMGTVVDAGKPFRETLQDGWLTTDILIKTLEKFSEDDTLVKAATQVKTFTQLFDTMKESVQSGWAVSWEYIIGDRDQATKMLTAISDGFNNLIQPSTDARNAMLKFWNENGGRDAVIEGLASAFKGLLSVLSPIKKAFSDVFPAMTGERLVEISTKFRDLMSKFKIGEKTTENLKNTFKGVFSVFKLGVTIVSKIASGFAKLVGAILPAGDGLLSITGTFGKFVSKAAEALASTNLIDSAFNGLSKVFGSVAKIFSKFTGGLAEGLDYAFTNIGNALSGFADILGEVFDAVDFKTIFAGMNTGILAIIGKSIHGFLGNLGDGIENATGFFNSIKETLSGVKDCFVAWQNEIKSRSLKNIAISVGILSASLLVLAGIDTKRLITALGAIGGLFLELFGTMALFETFLTGGKFGAMTRIGTAMTTLAISVLILLTAMKKISSLDYDDISKGIITVASLSAILVKSANSMNKASGMTLRASAGLILFATSINILTSAVVKLSGLKTKDLTKGLVGVGVLCAEIALFLKTSDFGGMGLKDAAGLVILAEALKVLSQSVTKLAAVDGKGLAKGLTSIGVLLTELSIFTKLTNGSSGIITTSIGLTVLAGAMLVLTKSMTQMSGMSWNEIAKGLTGIGGSLIIFAAAMRAMNGTLAGAAALVVASSSLSMLTPNLKTLGGMKWTSIAKGLTAMAGAFAVFGVAGALLKPLVPTILGLSASFALFGAGTAAVGVGLVAMSAGIASLAASFGALVAIGSKSAESVQTTVTAIVSGIAEAIPLIMQQIGAGIIAFSQVIINGAPVILQAITTIILATLQSISNTLPQIITLIGNIVTGTLQAIAARMPELVQAGIDIVLSLLDGISQNMQKIIEKGIDCIIGFLNGVASKISDVIQAGFNLMLAFINGMADGIRKNSGAVGEALANVLTALLEAALKLILGFVGKFLSVGVKLIESLIKGIKKMFGKVRTTAKKLIDDFIDTLKKKITKVKTIGKNIVTGLIDGIKSRVGSLADAAKNLASSFVDNLKKTLDIHSPSRVTYEIGVNVSKGLEKGIKAGGKLVNKAVRSIATDTVKTLDEMMKDTAKTMAYGKKAFQAYADSFGLIKIHSRSDAQAVKETAKAITDYGKALYKETDQYKQDSAALREHQKDLETLQKTRKKIKKEIDKYNKDDSAKSKQKVKDLKTDLKTINDAIKGAHQQIKEDQKTMAQHTKEVYTQMRDSLKDTIKGAIDPLKVSLDTQIDLFKKFGSDTEVTVQEILENMDSQVKGILQWNADLDKLVDKGFAKGLIEQLKDMGPSGANYVKAFMQMTTEEMNKANTAFSVSTAMTTQQLIDGFTDSLESAKQWAKNMQDLAARGLNQGILEALGELGPSSTEYLEAFMGMTTKQIVEFNKQYKEYLKLPSTVADDVIASYVYAGDHALSGFIEALTLHKNKDEEEDKALTTGLPYGEKLMEGVKQGLQNKKTDVTKTSSEVSKSVLDAARKHLSSSKGKSLASNMCSGMIAGLNSGKSSVTAAAAAVARAAYEAAMAELDINSPSRKFAEIGKFADMGFAQGLLSHAKEVTSATKDVGSNAMEALRNSIGNISAAINGEIDPVIRPVLDLSQIRKDAQSINGIFTPTRSIELAGAVNAAIDKRNGGNSGESDSDKKQKITKLEFVQNNYSPKALSRLDIYRQTNNQFSRLKGVLNDD